MVPSSSADSFFIVYQRIQSKNYKGLFTRERQPKAAVCFCEPNAISVPKQLLTQVDLNFKSFPIHSCPERAIQLDSGLL